MSEKIRQHHKSCALSTYGPPEEMFGRVMVMQSALKNCPHPMILHALEMICVKMQRLCTTPDHMDSIMDIAGYARTMAMILDAEEKEKEND